MSKSKFTVLIVMMALSMVGIIWVQAIWIRNAYAVRNENFNDIAALCLNNAAELIMSSQRMDFFNNHSPVAFPSAMGYPMESANYLSIRSYSSIDSDGRRIRIDNQVYSSSADTSEFRYNSRSYTFAGDNGVLSDSSTLLDVGKNENRSNPNSRDLTVRKQEFLDWVRKRMGEFYNLSDQLIMEIYQWEKTLDINNEDVENALKQTFAYAGIETPFEFAIIKNGQLQDGDFKKSKGLDFLKSRYMIRLFPANIIGQDVILSVVFPARANYVMRQVLWLLWGSLAFSLFIVATFGLSLFLILRQKKISEMKSDFLNNMTHEFKTPIATISLAADTISNPKVIGDETKVLQFISMIKKENSKMNKNVETILEIASLDKNEIQFNFEDVSMHTIIDHVLETIEIQALRRNGKIIKNYNAVNTIVSGDQEHLSNLVNNLLDNAIKYSPVNPEITITTSNTNNSFVFSVEDNGIGMTKAVMDKIFEQFYRQTSGNVHNVKGFGLGLYYVRTIIEAHKGTIHVTSEPEKGSCFVVSLPINTRS